MRTTVAVNFAVMAKELLELYGTGVLPNGLVTEAARWLSRDLDYLPYSQTLSIVETEVQRACMRAAADTIR
jgi:hypothetical protein